MHVFRLFFLCLLVGGLSACGWNNKPTLDAQALKQQWMANQVALNTVEHWDIKGRVSVTTADDGGTVSLFWQEKEAGTFLKLVAPFGRGGVDISPHEDGGVKMQDHQGRIHRAPNAQGLIWLRTGWNIPIDNMKKWVLGVVNDVNNPSIRVASDGTLAGFVSGEWKVDYHAFKEIEVNGVLRPLPRKMTIQSDALKVKIIISNWVL